MGAWKDLDEFLDEEFLELPISGKVYRIYDVDGETAMRVRRLAKVAQEVKAAVDAGEQVDLDADELDDQEAEDLFERVLGDAYGEMLANGVREQRIKFALQTAMIWIIADEESAQRFWEAGGQGEAIAPAAPNRAARRASAAVERTTRKQVSGTTTKVKSSRSTTRRTAPQSRGTKSSGSGA